MSNAIIDEIFGLSNMNSYYQLIERDNKMPNDHDETGKRIFNLM